MPHTPFTPEHRIAAHVHAMYGVVHESLKAIFSVRSVVFFVSTTIRRRVEEALWIYTLPHRHLYMNSVVTLKN